MPAPVFTATTRVVCSGPRARRSCRRQALKSVSERCASLTCKARSLCGGWTSIRSSYSSAMPVHRGRPAQPARWSGVGHLRQSAPVVVARRRCRVVAGDVYDSDPAGDRIPGSVESVISLGASIHEVRRFSGSVRLRFFGPRPLTEDGSAFERDKPCQRTSELSVGSALAIRRRFVQPSQRIRQRHRLLLHIASSGRAPRRGRRRSYSSGSAESRTRLAAGYFLVSMALVQMSISSGVIVPSGTSRAST